MTNIPPGDYLVAILHQSTLQVVKPITVRPVGNVLEMGVMRSGDINKDNKISALDFSILAGVFNTVDSDPDFDDRSDLNRDGAVTILDFSKLAANYNTAGDTLARR
ncbi:MAG: dockerin type I domain-containing protein [Chloroflexota bacterium]